MRRVNKSINIPPPLLNFQSKHEGAEFFAFVRHNDSRMISRYDCTTLKHHTLTVSRLPNKGMTFSIVTVA
jgi:hypothetical protein